MSFFCVTGKLVMSHSLVLCETVFDCKFQYKNDKKFRNKNVVILRGISF